ncbi:senescence-associated gene 13 [Striga asiatica]|uniref:Senescence-associated gene 13 n=1 Tax=Striga asiatica TaxID=4170 RepID=A0A5A7Q5S6_STRAF|nr:senescence-associated gene 13 [Striga asiatica]
MSRKELHIPFFVPGAFICKSRTIPRRSEASSLRQSFSRTTLSWVSPRPLSRSARPRFSFFRRTRWAHSSSRCLCFLILDRRADSRFEIILLRLRSSIKSSSEVELLLGLGLGFGFGPGPKGWWVGKLVSSCGL